MDNYQIIPANPCDREVVKLIQALDHYQQQLYPEESNHLDAPETLLQSDGYFVVAKAQHRLLGCGAIKYIVGEIRYGEMKRLFVKPESRGQGISKRIIAALEQHARQSGVRVVRLETGIYQPEAIGLYQALGYCRRAAFGNYSEHDSLSVFMEKRLQLEGSWYNSDD